MDTQTHQVFISYSSEDSLLIERLAQGLRARDLNVFSDSKIRVGENWAEVLRRSLASARFIVVAMTPAYFRSKRTEHEWTLALDREAEERRVVLLPVLLQDCVIPPRLRDKTFADLRSPRDYDTAITHLNNIIQTYLAEDSFAETAFEPDSPPTPVVFDDDLINQIRDGSCVLYAGSGLSAPAGLPSWPQFAQQLVRAAADSELVGAQDVEFYTSALRDRKTDYVVDEIVGSAPAAFLQQFLAATFLGKTPPEAHQVVRDLPFAAALTTNFDDLLERTLSSRLAGLAPFTPQDTEALLTAFTRRTFFVLKLYGSLDRPASVLVSPAQFDRAISENRPFQDFMDGLFVSRTILFVGASLEGIETYLRGLRLGAQSTPRRHYALAGVLGTSWEAMAGVLERRYGIHVIPYRRANATDQLHALWELRSRVVTNLTAVTKRTGATPLTKVTLNNIGPFEQEEITFDPKVNILLGNNGVGKSTVLRAIAVALCGKDAEPHAARLIRAGAPTASIQIVTEHQTYTTVLQRTNTGAEVTSLPIRALEAEGWLALGFPPLRTTSSTAGRPSRDSSPPFPTVNDLLPLVRGDADLRLDDLQQWIVDLDYRAKHEVTIQSGDTRYERQIRVFFDTVSRLLHGVKVEFQAVDPATKRITVLTDDGPVPFDYISQGASSLISWVGVLLQRLYEIYGDRQDPTARYVLVLMDEIDAHMHPTWQQVLLPRIVECFPGMQLIATTHSPLILSGLESRNILHVLRSSETHRVAVRRYEMKLKGQEADEILTGPLFGLEDTRDLETQDQERRYDELRTLESPTADQSAARESLARELFGRRAPSVSSATKAVYAALEASIAEKLKPASEEERSRRLAEAEKLIKSMIEHH
jgi:predicted ATPase